LAFDLFALRYNDLSSALCRGATHFFLDEKVGKKSRKNDASPLKTNAWPAVLSGHRSLDSSRVEVVMFRL